MSSIKFYNSARKEEEKLKHVRTFYQHKNKIRNNYECKYNYK